ncbi:hypothetical protein KIN20_021083 [Parelaphostrongylus tenuis]|uniref:Uncharacterized protein n=1 Tax=Parelaphostrongylus tenuis TaxID=148309 RepID=A0AAD5QU80_PARTN|nr:hypothetical protein KIN20_021083 [Parelaphostrongylus tenuis]
MPRLPINPFIILLLTAISAVLGCGVIPMGQASTRTFNVTGFTLPVAMVYSSAPDVQAQVPGIASSEGGAQTFVSRLVMQTVFDVLERQARSALLPDAVISAILNQLEVKMTYGPMNCPRVALSLMDTVKQNEPKCIVISNTVTGICTHKKDPDAKCDNPAMTTVTSVPVKYTSFSGTLSTTNIIMSSWSKAMWQSVVDRAIRMLASGPLRSHFLSASATVGGN